MGVFYILRVTGLQPSEERGRFALFNLRNGKITGDGKNA
jgi:hypothetical protein